MASLGATLQKLFRAGFLRAPVARREAVKSAPSQIVLNPVSLQEFLALEIPQRNMLLDPIMPERSLSMLYAPRGVGKSWIALGIALAVASGGNFLRWSAPRPRKVLFVDGEMLLVDLQARLASLRKGIGTEFPPENFQLLAADQTEFGINLGNEDGQRALESVLTDIDLVVFDNLSTLLAHGSEGASDAWLPIQNWLLRLRRKGVAVLLVHHAGVNGKQRGTSRREDALDTVIALRRPADYSPEQGARFEVHVEKARSLFGQGALPFEAQIESGENGIHCSAKDLPEPLFKQAAALFAEGQSVRAVAAQLGLSRSEAGRQRQKAQAEGLLGRGEKESGEPETALGGGSLRN